MTDDDLQEAARRSIDSDRVVPGQGLNSIDGEAAAHWAQIYRELMETRHLLSDHLRAVLEPTGTPAPEASPSVDTALMRLQLGHFERRFKYWSERERELNGLATRR